MKNALLIFTCVFFLAAAVGASAQTVERSFVMKTANGDLVVWNEPGNCYTIEIKGKTVEPVPQNMLWFTVNGKFFQVVTAAKKQFLKDANGKSLDEKAILAAHRDWESDYISETLKSKLMVESASVKLPNGMEALAWSFDMPHVDDRQTAKRQLYLAVVKRDHVLALNTVVEANDDEKVLQLLLIDTMITLKPGDKPISPDKARELVLKGN